MARKLKTYTTSIGFFELAVAAPSMKAALEAWRSGRNLFHSGLARETDDRAAVAATTARPGVVLKRPIGSKGPFKEQADLPKSLPVEEETETPARPKARKPSEREKPAPRSADTDASKVVVDLEKERRRRERDRRKEERARKQERRRREQAIAKAGAALKRALDAHEARMQALEQERASLDERAQAEEARWEKLREKLKDELRRARDA